MIGLPFDLEKGVAAGGAFFRAAGGAFFRAAGGAFFRAAGGAFFRAAGGAFSHQEVASFFVVGEAGGTSYMQRGHFSVGATPANKGTAT